MKLKKSLRTTNKIVLFLIMIAATTANFAHFGSVSVTRIRPAYEAAVSVYPALILSGTTTAVTSDINPSLVGQPVTYTAMVTTAPPGSGTITGTVAFQDNGGPLGRCNSQPVSAGQASCVFSIMTAGVHQITAVYNGDTNFAPSTSPPLSQTINMAATTTDLTSSKNPASPGQNVTFTAVINVTSPGSGSPTGSVAFLDNGANIPSCTSQNVINAQATCSISTLSAGSHQITAVYGGDTNFGPSTSSPLSQAINQAGAASTVLTSSINPVTVGQNVTFTAAINVTSPGSGSPTGSVAFLDNGVDIPSCTAQSVINGQATCSISTLLGGSHQIKAVYSGDTNYPGSTSNTVTQVINASDTSAPTASILLTNVSGSGATSYSFVVTYSDNIAINVSTIDNNDIVVTGPNGFAAAATLVSVNNLANGTPRIATYSFIPPGGTWDAADAGLYTISMSANQVADTAGLFVNAGALGTFLVSLGDLVVDRTDDSFLANPCTSAPNDCTLRSAIMTANASPGADSIAFDQVIFATPQTITLGGSEIVIADSGGLQINGPSSKLLTISANNASRIFTNSPGAVTAISGVRLTGGNGAGAAASGRGGAVYNNGGELTLGGVVVIGNSAANGGGLSNANPGALLNVISSWVTENTATSSGGGLQNLAGVTTNIVGSSFTRNVSNSASLGGGGIQANGTMTITNSTIAGNLAPAGSAGGIYFNGSAMTITNSTIAYNTSLTNGGGLHIGSVTPPSIRNSIIAGNAGTAGSPDITGIAASLGNNIVGVVGTSSGWTALDLLNTDPKMAPLGFYGSGRQTVALTSASPAINAGQLCVINLSCASTNPPLALNLDQRGAERIGAVDIGAFELNNSANGGTYVANLPNGLQGTPYNFQLIPNIGSFSHAVAAGSLPPGITLNVNSSGTSSLIGTPSLSGDYHFSLNVSGGGNSNITDYRMIVFAPVGTGVSISGRVLLSNGQLPGVVTLVLTSEFGIKRRVLTSPFGYYQFDNVPAGATYTIILVSNRHTSTPLTFDLNYNLTNVDLEITSLP